MNLTTLPKISLKGRRAKRIAAVGSVAAYCAVCTILIFHRRPDRTRTRVGQFAPSFRITTTSGQVFDLAAPRHHPVLVTFFATWCGPCAKELRRLEPEVWQKMRGQGLTLLAISIDDGDAAIKRFWSEKGLTFPAASDAGRKMFSKYAAKAIPRTYLIDVQGRIVYQSVGYTEEEFSRLLQALDKALPSLPTEEPGI